MRVGSRWRRWRYGLERKGETVWRATTEDTNNVLEDENDLVLAMKIKQDVLPCERKPVKCLGQNISSAGPLPNSAKVGECCCLM